MAESSEQQAYTVLARKYRPASFKDLIGQDALVQTLTHAIEQQRIAHAFILTGIRGVGKTSTARIIARALNCIGEDGNGAITPDPCGKCEHCIAIAEGRHQDVLEVDAASRTGVADIREIIDNAQYLPSSARFKIYIIDEVHMLSKSAFNALLKTLEEPPGHVKFIFATTEIRKIPVTILSRCQRFDLPRIEAEQLVTHLQSICEQEKVTIAAEALNLIANAAEGSVRDALSLLDQAIAYSGDSKQVELSEVQSMLGLVSKDGVYTIFEHITKGDAAAALTQFKELYHSGADPQLILQDLLEITHFLTQIKVIPELAKAPHIPQNERDRAKALAEKLALPYLARCWQMLLKGASEVASASNTLMATEMVLVRLAYTSDLPTPGDLIKKITTSDMPHTNGAMPTPELAPQEQVPAPALAVNDPDSAPPPIENTPPPATAPIANPTSFEDIVTLFQTQQEFFLYNWLKSDVHLVEFAPLRLEIRLSEAAPTDLPGRLTACLRRWTKEKWLVIVSNEAGSKSLREQEEDAFAAHKKACIDDPNVQAVLDVFPGAEVKNIETAGATPHNTEEDEPTPKQQKSTQG